jgi:hypothetical protein
MALQSYFSGLQVSADGTNFSRVFANAADSDNLTLSSYSGTIVSTAANFIYVDSSAVATNLNTTLDGLKVLADAAATAVDLTTEASTRASVDATLQASVDAEQAAREAAVTTLEGADATLQTNITAEATARAADFVADRARLDAIEALLGNLQSA